MTKAKLPPSAYRCSVCGQGWGVPIDLCFPQYPSQLSFNCPKGDEGNLVADYGGLREDDYIDAMIMESFHPGSTAGFFEETR